MSVAVVTQHPYINEQGEEDKKYVKSYSDEGKPLIKLQTGEEYVDKNCPAEQKAELEQGEDNAD